jgi:AraC-like DNA-binding protein
LRLTIPREESLARVADALLDDVGDDRTLDAWAHVAGMARRTFMRAFSAQAGMSLGRWRQQVRLFAALEMLAQRKSVTEVAIAVGYDSVSAFIEMFRTILRTTHRHTFEAGVRGHAVEPWTQRRAFLDAVAIPPGTGQRLLVLASVHLPVDAASVDRYFPKPIHDCHWRRYRQEV